MLIAVFRRIFTGTISTYFRKKLAGFSMKSLALCLVLVAVARAAPQKRCICLTDYDPVCGDGKTYSNECQATCGGAKNIESGACEENGCICPTVYDPVCDGRKTWPSKCWATCSGETRTIPGPCNVVGHHNNGNGVSHHSNNEVIHHALDGSACSCPASYDLVCGADGKTYANRCVATCNRVTRTSPGSCNVVGHHNNGNGVSHHSNNEVIHYALDGSPCVCPTSYDLVCGADRKTYANRCVATCNRVTRITPGSCNVIGHHGNNECACGTVYDPVCGADGETYSSECRARCNRITRTIPGPCDRVSHFTNEVVGHSLTNKLCICPQNYALVCGADRRTYANQCMATCNFITRTIDGPCEDVMQHEDPEEQCNCPRIEDPVCDTETSETFPNTCEAACHGVSDPAPGACYQVSHFQDDNCWCPRVYSPVCGDGNTYVSACLAACGGASTVTDGECNQVEPW